MNKSDKLFMETAEKQQEIIDVLREACEAVQEAYKLKDDALTFQITMDSIMNTIDKAINKAKGA